MSLLAGGAGQFIAALRSTRIYAVAIMCTALSLLLLSAPMFGVGFAMDWLPEFVRVRILSPASLVSAGLLFAVASLLFAALLPFVREPKAMARPEAMDPAMLPDDADPTGITVLTKDNVFRRKP